MHALVTYLHLAPSAHKQVSAHVLADSPVHVDEDQPGPSHTPPPPSTLQQQPFWSEFKEEVDRYVISEESIDEVKRILDYARNELAKLGKSTSED